MGPARDSSLEAEPTRTPGVAPSPTPIALSPSPMAGAVRLGPCGAHGVDDARWEGHRATLARAVADRATRALLQRDTPESTEQMHAAIYGDSALAHTAPPPPYEFSEDLLDPDFGGFRPGPLRTTLIRPKIPTIPAPSQEWIEEALKRDKLLKQLPDWAREKAIGALKDADELAAEKIIGALPWDDKAKAAATAAIKSVLQLLKGRTFKVPEAPPATRTPEWRDLPEMPSAPGEKIFQLPPIRF